MFKKLSQGIIFKYYLKTEKNYYFAKLFGDPCTDWRKKYETL